MNNIGKYTLGALSILLVAIGIVNLVAILEDSGQALDRFKEYFSKDRIVKITYEKADGITDIEWIGPRGTTFKKVRRDKQGELIFFSLIEKGINTTYDIDYERITQERFRRYNTPEMALAVQDAYRGKLKKVRSFGGKVFYDIPTSDDDGVLVYETSVEIDKDTGEPAGLDYYGASIDRIELLPIGRSQKVFTDGELKDATRVKEVSLGFTKRSIARFKPFTPYWLGPKFMGRKLYSSSDFKMDKEPFMSISYGAYKNGPIDLNESPFSVRHKIGKDTYKTKIAGHPAELFEDSGTYEVYVYTPTTEIHSSISTSKNRNQLIELLSEHLEPVR